MRGTSRNGIGRLGAVSGDVASEWSEAGVCCSFRLKARVSVVLHQADSFEKRC